MSPEDPTIETAAISRRANKIMPGWDLVECDKTHRSSLSQYSHRARNKRHSPHSFSPDWANSVPSLISQLASEIAEKKKMELRFTAFGIVVKDLKARIGRLELSKTRIVPINTFVPEPYELLSPILVSVQLDGDVYEAGWYDANIHSSGDNEEEAVANLKSLILDYFDSFSSQPPEKLGIEPTRQLSILKTFISKRV